MLKIIAENQFNTKLQILQIAFKFNSQYNSKSVTEPMSHIHHVI